MTSTSSTATASTATTSASTTSASTTSTPAENSSAEKPSAEKPSVQKPSAENPSVLRLAVIIGSNREGRFGPVIAAWLLDRIRERADLMAEIVDVADAQLPTTFARPPQAGPHEVARTLEAADAFVVLTPEYNHSFPAALKNLIDWHYTEWRAKPVAFVSYGGVSGGLRATEHLRQVFAELHATTIRDTVSFHNAGASFDDEGRHREPAGVNAAAKVMLDQLVWWGEALREARAARPYAG
ncbi:NADPH-dependent FMN reductase [Streptomyces cavernae]|uniref:NADPH-dependent FMN reductase n=1 Tax=Streptomyces cavernae TaxID=2259034 RepID=UPI000FEBE7D5|nr:NAD(P)H-dependent oxidoreductase [Streptomyces cavernae]